MQLQELKEAELEVIKETRKEFLSEVILSEEGIEMLLNFISIIAEKKAVGTKSHARYTVFILSNRMLRILKCAHDSMLKGYYEITMVFFDSLLKHIY